MYWLTSDEFDELDQEFRVLVESTGAEQMPDLNPEQSIIFQMESLAKSASCLLADVIQQGGMSRELAMEMHAAWPELGEKHHLLEYSEVASRTLYVISLEEINLGIAAAIAAGFAALMAIIYKLWKWMFNGKSKDDAVEGSRDEMEKAEQQARAANRVAEEVKKVAEVVAEAPKPVHDAATDAIEKEVKQQDGHERVHVIAYSKDQLVAAAMRLAMAKHATFESVFGSVLFHDVMSHGEWFKAATDSARALKEAYPILQQRVAELTKIARLDPSGPSETFFQHITAYVEKYPRDKNDKGMEDNARHVSELAAEKSHKRHDQPLDADAIGRRIGELEHSGVIQLIGTARGVVLELGAELMGLETAMKWMGDAATLEKLLGTEDHKSHAGNLRAIHTDVAYLSQLINAHYKSINTTMTALMKYGSAYTEFMNMAGNIVHVQLAKHAATSSDADKERTYSILAKIKGFFGRKPALTPYKKPTPKQ